MAATLDRTRAFATVCGDGEGRFFEQDNLFFGADGRQWVAAGAAATAAVAPAAAPAPAAKKAKAAPVSRLATQLEGKA